jgi:hypothetical protein
MMEAVRRLSEPEPSSAGLNEFRRLTADRSINHFMDDSARLRLAEWLTHPDHVSNPDRVPIFGASYLSRNTTASVQADERRALVRLKAQDPHTLHLRWYRPAGSSWGATRDLQTALNAIGGVVRSVLSADWELTTALAVPAAVRKGARRFQRMFDRILGAPANHLAGASEIVCISGIAAMVLTQVEVAKGIAVPIGWILVNPTDVARIDAALGQDSSYEILSSISREQAES